MAVDFLTDEQAARYGSFHGVPSRAELEPYFFLDNADQEAAQAKRRAHNRLGFAVQLTPKALSDAAAGWPRDGRGCCRARAVWPGWWTQCGRRRTSG